MSEAQSARKRVFKLLNPSDKSDFVGRIVDYALMTLIVLNIIAVMLETDIHYHIKHQRLFQAFDVFSVIVFSIEYALRLWSAPEDPRLKSKTMPRLRYMFTPMAVVDLLAILPFYLSLVLPIDLRVLRALRLLRVFKLTRYSSAMNMLLAVMREEASVLFAAFFLLFVLLILAASGAYLFEHQVQPEVFGSIPQSMWWAVVTLTTLGYGDVVPMTTGGRIFGGVVTIIGLGMAALPAGILASGFAEHMHQRRNDLRQKYREALRDGVIDAKEHKALEKLRRSLGLSHLEAKRIEQEVHDQNAHEAHMRVCPKCGYRGDAPVEHE